MKLFIKFSATLMILAYLIGCSSIIDSIDFTQLEDFKRPSKSSNSNIELLKSKDTENDYTENDVMKNYTTIGIVEFTKFHGSGGGACEMIQVATMLAKGGKLSDDEIEQFKSVARQYGADALLDVGVDTEKSRTRSSNYSSYTIYSAKAIVFD